MIRGMTVIDPTPEKSGEAPAPLTPRPEADSDKTGQWLAVAGILALLVLAFLTQGSDEPDIPLEPPSQFETGLPNGTILLIASPEEGLYTLNSEGDIEVLSDGSVAYAYPDRANGIVAVTKKSEILRFLPDGIETPVSFPLFEGEEFENVITAGIVNEEPSVLIRTVNAQGVSRLTLLGLESGDAVSRQVPDGRPSHGWIGSTGISVDFVRPNTETFTLEYDSRLKETDINAACREPEPECPTQVTPSPDGKSRITQYDHWRLVYESGKTTRELIGSSFIGSDIALHDFDGNHILLDVGGYYRIQNIETGSLITIIHPLTGNPIESDGSIAFIY